MPAGRAMTAPRNLRLHRQGQRLRAEIREALASHNPLLPPLTAKGLRGRLQCRPLPAVRTVQGHMAMVRIEAILAEAAGCSRSGVEVTAESDRPRSAQFIP